MKKKSVLEEEYLDQKYVGCYLEWITNNTRLVYNI